MTYIPIDYQVDRETTVQKLFQEVNVLVDQYSRYIDVEGAGFIRDYFISLRHDLELALESRDQRKTRLVTREIKQLCRDLQRRIDLVKKEQGESVGERRRSSTDKRSWHAEPRI